MVKSWKYLGIFGISFHSGRLNYTERGPKSTLVGISLGEPLDVKVNCMLTHIRRLGPNQKDYDLYISVGRMYWILLVGAQKPFIGQSRHITHIDTATEVQVKAIAPVNH